MEDIIYIKSNQLTYEFLKSKDTGSGSGCGSEDGDGSDDNFDNKK